MSEPYRVKPDGEFLREILARGGKDLKKCFQCATCSVVCQLSADARPFPRKEMIWAQWGLRDRLLADPDVWLCHQCNDCTTRCPRGARPGDVLAAVREQGVIHYAFPAFFAKWANRPVFLPLMLLLPASLLALALAARDPLGNALGLTEHPAQGMQYARLFPHWLLIGFFTFFSGLAFVAAASGIARFWKAMRAADPSPGAAPQGGLAGSVLRTVKSVLAHGKFTECGDRRSRYLAHLGAFYGFVLLLLVTFWAIVVLYVINPLSSSPLLYPFAWWNPVKILANLGALGLIAGCLLAIRDRLSGTKDAPASTSFDWTFVWMLLGVGATGLATEVLRWAELQGAGYTVYFVHLMLVFALLIYLPYSKFAHVVYRTVALVYCDYTGRENPAGARSGRQKDLRQEGARQ